tara:strand:+ start:550 stop:729 length:180 start_codon:yes stop_codon:yes gene_type:complete
MGKMGKRSREKRKRIRMNLNEVLETVAEQVSLLLASEEQEQLVGPVLSVIWETFNKLEE